MQALSCRGKRCKPRPTSQELSPVSHDPLLPWFAFAHRHFPRVLFYQRNKIVFCRQPYSSNRISWLTDSVWRGGMVWVEGAILAPEKYSWRPGVLFHADSDRRAHGTFTRIPNLIRTSRVRRLWVSSRICAHTYHYLPDTCHPSGS